jgi:hypothetical protein
VPRLLALQLIPAAQVLPRLRLGSPPYPSRARLLQAVQKLQSFENQ